MTDISTLLDTFATFRHPYPRDAVQALVDAREQALPLVLQRFQREVAALEQGGEVDEEDNFIFRACYLLGCWRAPEAHPLLVRLLRLPTGTAEDALGDALTESMGAILVATCAGDFTAMTALAADVDLDSLVRSAALSGLILVALQHPEHRAQVLATFLDILSVPGDEDNIEDDEFRELASANILDLHPVELREDLRRLWDEGKLHDSVLITWKDFTEELDHPQPPLLHALGDIHQELEPYVRVDALTTTGPGGSPPGARPKPRPADAAKKAKRKAAKKARKKNRRK